MSTEVDERRERALQLIAFFDDKAMRENVNYSQGETILNMQHFLEAHAHALKTMSTKGRIWKLHYIRLYKLKKYLEDEKNK